MRHRTESSRNFAPKQKKQLPPLIIIIARLRRHTPAKMMNASSRRLAQRAMFSTKVEIDW
jgi:hypothetical protein